MDKNADYSKYDFILLGCRVLITLSIFGFAAYILITKGDIPQWLVGFIGAGVGYWLK